MKEKIDQFDAREADLIKKFDVQSEKFGGIFIVDEFIRVDISPLLFGWR